MTVFLLAAVTLDGFIGRNETDRSFDWTSLEDKQFYVKMIKQAGAVVMGGKTFQTFTKYPKGLEYVIYTRTPEKFINPKPEVITAWATAEEPAEVLKKLAAAGHEQVAICGGATIYSVFLQAGLVDKIYLTVEPVLFGSGVKLFSGELNKRCQLVSQQKLNDNTLLLEYELVKSSKS